jgi:uncharacterized protein (TIGR02246 family)
MLPELAKLRDFAMRYTVAWCSQNPENVAAHFSPEGSLTINHGTPAAGRNAITKAAQSFMTAFPDLRVIMENILIKVTVRNTTGHSSAPTTDQVVPGTGFASAGSRSGRSTLTG